MDIGLQSQMLFGDDASLYDFFLVHRMLHDQYAVKIAAAGKGATPTGGMSSESALQAWISAMRKQGPGSAPVLLDWLKLHQNLHQAEYQALGFGLLPDLIDVDFSLEDQFYDWMYGHAAIHTIQSQALGVT